MQLNGGTGPLRHRPDPVPNWPYRLSCWSGSGWGPCWWRCWSLSPPIDGAIGGLAGGFAGADRPVVRAFRPERHKTRIGISEPQMIGEVGLLSHDVAPFGRGEVAFPETVAGDGYLAVHRR